MLSIPQRFRPLARRPLFCAGVIVILGLSVGLSSAMFGLVRATMFLPTSTFDASRTFAILMKYTGERWRRPRTSMTLAKIEEFARHPPPPLESVIARQVTAVVVRFGDRAERVAAEFVLGDYQKTVGLRPGIGRFLDASYSASGSDDTVVVSDRIWREWFAPSGAEPGTARLLVDGHLFDVIGATPRGFRGLISYQPVEIWLPASAWSTIDATGSAFAGQIFVRAPHGMAARTVADVVRSALADGANPLSIDEFALTAVASDALTRDSMGRVGWIVIAFGALVMVAGSVNVLNLIHVYFSARTREFAIRRAVGASSASLVVTCVSEIATLAAAASAIGIAVAWGLLASIDQATPLGTASGRSPTWANGAVFSIAADQVVIAYALLSMLISSAVLSAAAVFRVLRVSSENRLIGTASANSAGVTVRRVILSLQVTIATILMMVTAAFLARLAPLVDQSPVIDTAGVTSARIDLSLHGFSDITGREFYQRLLTRVSQTAGIASAALTDGIPGYAYVSLPNFQLVAEPKPGALSNARRNFLNGSYAGVSEKFFDVMRLRIVNGRGVAAADGYGAPLVAVITESVATRLWPGGEALGKRIMFGNEGQWRTVVGVSEDPIRLRNDSGAVCRACVVFVPFQQRYHATMVFIIRSDSAPHGEAIVRAAIAQENRDVIPFDLGSLDSTLLRALWRERSAALIISATGIVALLIAAAGVFSSTAYLVSLRAFEMAVRTALGATPRRLVGLMLHDVRLVTLIGLLAGVTVVAIGERGFSALIKGFMPNDLWIWAAVLISVPAVTIGAGYLAARRSGRVQPARLLRGGD